MADDDIQHHVEVRRGRRVGPVLVVVGLALVAAFALGLRDGGGPPEAATATSTSSPPTTRTGPLPLVHIIADTDRGPRPATTADGPGGPTADGAFEAVQATPIVTEGQVVVLVDGGTVLAGRPGEGFRTVDVGGPASALVASNEPGHVWVVASEDELQLVDIEGTDPPVRIPLGGERVIGPATFGVVTVDAAGRASWRRPGFDPAPLSPFGGNRAVDAGGGFVLVEAPAQPGGPRVFRTVSAVDSTAIRRFAVRDPDRPVVLATDGTAVALPVDDGWLVQDSITGQPRGSLPSAPGTPVWIGDGRFALLVAGVVATSDGSELAPPWRVRDLAEQSP